MRKLIQNRAEAYSIFANNTQRYSNESLVIAITSVMFVYPLATLLTIHSGHFHSASSSPLLLRGTPDYSTDTVSEFHAEAHR